MNRPRNWWLILGGILMGAALLIKILSANFALCSAVFRWLGLWIGTIMGGISSLVPFPLTEWLIFLLPIFLIVLSVYTIKKYQDDGYQRALSRLLFLISLLAFIFEAGYGVQYTAPPLADSLDLEVGLYTTEELGEVMILLLEQANDWAEQVPRNEEGNCAFAPFGELSRQVMAAYDTLAQTYPYFDTPRKAKPKKGFLLSDAMLYFNVAGYYSPFTGEGIVSGHVADSHVPFNAAHEAAHSMGVGPEDEANFAAFLACLASDDPQLVYSGYLCAYVYASNALYAADAETYRQIVPARSPLVQNDLAVHSASLKKYDTPVATVGSVINDTYIKATGQPNGIQSYGKVVDLLLSYYMKRN